MSKLHGQVLEFMQKMGQDTDNAPGTLPPPQVMRLRAALVVEETFELVEALLHRRCGPHLDNLQKALLAEINSAPLNPDLTEIVDALADLDYVVEGCRIAFGIDGEPVADLVHENNMTKLDGPIAPNGKRLKPPGWTPPDIAGEIQRQATQQSKRGKPIFSKADWGGAQEPGDF